MTERRQHEEQESTGEITTRVRRKKKLHDKFKAILQFDSMPIELEVEAEKTEIKFKELTRNPKKYSFGKVPFRTGKLEACIYPEKNLYSVLWYFSENPSAKRNEFSTDSRRLNEILNLIMRIRYFLGLSAKRKVQYLRKHGHFANINT